MRRVALDGYDLTLDGRLGLNLFRDSRRPAVQGGRFGPSEQMRNPGATEQAVILDRLDGGVGAVERLVPNTYPLAIDGCTRFSRAWTPSGEITHLPAVNPLAGGQPGRIRSMVQWRDRLVVGAGQVIYQLAYPYTAPIEMGRVGPNEEVEDLLEFEGCLLAGTRNIASGLPGLLWGWDDTLGWISGTAYRQHLVKSYQEIDNVGAWRLTGNDTPWTFRFVAVGATGPQVLADILTDSVWPGVGGQYPVGDYSARITNLAGSPLVMFFAKEDGVYHVGPDGRAARVVDWSGSQHPSNGEVFAFAYGGLYASHVRWGLVRVDVANLQVQWQTNACAPGANLPRVVPGSGRITAFGLDGEWLVAGVFNGTDSYTYYGRPVEITERTAMINLQSPQSLNWHGSEATFWGMRATAIRQATIGPADRPLLWVGLEPAGGGPSSLACVSLPKYGTPLEDWQMGGPHRFQELSWLYYPRQDWGDERGGPYGGWASVRKVFNRLDLTADYLERYQTWVDAYMANAGGHALFWDRALDPEATLWTQVGRFDEGDRISLVPGKTVQSGLRANLMLRGFCVRDKPFAFYGSKLRGTPMVEQSERRQYRVTFGRSRKANQGQDHRELLPALNELWALQWADPVSLSDQYRLPLVVDIEPTMSYEDSTNPATGEPEVVATFSCRIVRRGFIWGSGYRFGSDIVWS
jgi:hypothetical protein